jgi:hypothetical protein
MVNRHSDWAVSGEIIGRSPAFQVQTAPESVYKFIFPNKIHIGGCEPCPTAQTEASGSRREVSTAGNAEFGVKQMGKSGPKLGEGGKSFHWSGFFLKISILQMGYLTSKIRDVLDKSKY